MEAGRRQLLAVLLAAALVSGVAALDLYPTVEAGVHSAPPAPAHPRHGLGAGAIAVIVAGAALVLAVAVAVCCCCFCASSAGDEPAPPVRRADIVVQMPPVRVRA